MRVFLYFAILAVSQNAIYKSFELFCFLKFFSIFSQKNSSKTGSEALTCFGSRNLGRSIFPFVTLWEPVPEARVGIKKHGAFASWFRADRTWIFTGIAKAGWILSQLKPNAPFRSRNKFHGFSFVFREKSIISYSFIEFLSQTQKAAKPFCNDLAAFIWSYWPDLNRRPADYESAALPTERQ